ncbi:hypothetical protein [Staphylococcus pseudoxylosus]|uniref:hypothetical protein n=1 Tax=Staphylococcus pseudoxylosus TaxID=2282419 RepID=UPI000D1EC020|nr:hypothetical protein [Staphylococcus pseudoxylosus]MBM2657574.1 hypothetical protein [Staphylococcus pseudoxylosus]MEB5782418.1 hypothetical protein [Staphylococcus pseudoxylosus]PTI83649.1 hypothetical protein BU098_01840 [Staphylococcus xylosus]
MKINNVKSYWDKILSVINKPLTIIISRIICFIVAVVLFFQFLNYGKLTLLNINKEASHTNLGILVNALQNNWLIGAQVSFTIVILSVAVISFLGSITKLLAKPLYLKLLFFCYVGVPVIVFIFTIVLLSTKPSDTTIIFSVLSAIGASIAFCFTVYMSLKR